MKLDIVPIDSIVVEDRAREDMGEIHELAYSIKARGLIQPLAVQKIDSGYRLLAGGRRLEAIRRNGDTSVGVRVYEDSLSSLEIKSIELAENFYRKNLTWQEEVKLQREIHEMQQELHGKKQPGGRPDVTGESPGWDISDTANLSGFSRQRVGEDLKLAEAIEAFPDLFRDVKQRSDATKILRRVANNIKHEELAKQVEEQKLVGWKQQLIDSYIIKDFFDGVAKVPDKSIDLVEIDPPYSIDLKQIKKDYCYGPSYNEICKTAYPTFLYNTFKECYRVMADHSWLICWFGPEPWFNTIHSLLRSVGFKCNRIVGVWTKGHGQANRPDLYLASSYEMFFYARKGEPRIVKQGRANVFDYPPVAAQKKIHPTERPVAMMKDMLETFAWEKSRVLVPFLGSGNTLLAAHEAKMNGFGFELSEEYRNSFVVKVNELTT